MKISNKFLLLISFLLFACGNNKKKYSLNAKYVVEKQVKGINFGVYVLSENEKDSSLNIALKINAIDNSNILKYGILDQTAYLQRIYYFSYQIENDLWIEQNGIKIPCAGAVFERNYNLTKDVTITVHFDNVVKNNKKVLVYYPQPFDLIPVKFKLK